jgi:hypothetical protein
MRKTISFMIVMFIGILTPISHAVADETGSGLGVSGVAQLMLHITKDKREQRSLLGKVIYMEKKISGDSLSFLQVYHDQEFESMIIGYSMTWGNFQGALGIGTARYSNTTRTLVNPWLYYSNEETGIEGLLYAERYRHDRKDPLFVKMLAQKKFESNPIAGVYGETFAGVGPMLGYQFTKKFSARVVVPVAKLPDTGRVHALILFSLSF